LSPSVGHVVDPVLAGRFQTLSRRLLAFASQRSRMARQSLRIIPVIRSPPKSPRSDRFPTPKSIGTGHGVRVFFFFLRDDNISLSAFASPNNTPTTQNDWIKSYGKTLRFQGYGRVSALFLTLVSNLTVHQHDYRLISYDFRAVSYILNSPLYEKPWQTRALLSRLIDRGTLVASQTSQLLIAPTRRNCNGG